MWDDEHGSFEEMLRSLAREVQQAAERMAEFDYDDVARGLGFDPSSVRRWVDEAGDWLRSQSERPAGWPPRPDEPVADADTPSTDRPSTAGQRATEDALRGAAPHPLDLPTDEQGVALAALDSGRWAVEPGTEALTARGEGPGPNDALGLVRELRARDWISVDGALTATGRRALARWLESATRR